MIGRYRKVFVSLFSDLQLLAHSPNKLDLCFSIQERLIAGIRKIEAKIRRTKKQRDNLNDILKNQRLPKHQSRQVREELGCCIDRIDFQHRILSVFRDVGDGIAYLYINKWDIKPLCLSNTTAS